MTDRSGEATGTRRGQLLAIKLRALVTEHRGTPTDAVPEPLANGAAMIVDERAWVLVDGDAGTALGGALAWAIRHDALSLDLIAERDTGLLARRVARFRLPIAVWHATERTLLPAVVESLPAAAAPALTHLALVPVIEGSGASAVVEHGVVTGEVRGLEVCRVVDAPTSGYFDEPDGGPPVSAMTAGSALADGEQGGVIVEVGVGAPDREAFRIIHGDIPTVDALRGVVDTVSRYRSPGTSPHPLSRLVPERLLRWRLECDPSLIDMTSIVATEPPLPRRGLNEVAPCVATATDPQGGESVVVCSAGVDLDLIPFVADVQSASGRPVVVALPSRDLVAITNDLADLLVEPVRIVPIDS